MRNLVIDIGNTNSKIAVFEDNTLLEWQRETAISPAVLEAWLQKYEITHTTLSSVGKEADDLIRVLKERTSYIPFSTEITGGIINEYETPQTLGLDRWAKLIAAKRIYNATNCLLIDAGTCITYDLLTSTAHYYGGAISPGINMRFTALHNYTGRLPLIHWERTHFIPQGSSTQNAIKNGVLQGIVNEVEGFIGNYNSSYKLLKILITGGDAEFFCHHLKNSIFAPQITVEPLLVLKGLNEVITLETCI